MIWLMRAPPISLCMCQNEFYMAEEYIISVKM